LFRLSAAWRTIYGYLFGIAELVTTSCRTGLQSNIVDAPTDDLGTMQVFANLAIRTGPAPLSIPYHDWTTMVAPQ
jgi:hypothetical protein